MIGKFCVLLQGYAREGFRTKADAGEENPDSYAAEDLLAGHGPVDMGVAKRRIAYDTVAVRRTFIVRHISGWLLLSLRTRRGHLFVQIVCPRAARCRIRRIVRGPAAMVSMYESTRM